MDAFFRAFLILFFKWWMIFCCCKILPPPPPPIIVIVHFLLKGLNEFVRVCCGRIDDFLYLLLITVGKCCWHMDQGLQKHEIHGHLCHICTTCVVFCVLHVSATHVLCTPVFQHMYTCVWVHTYITHVVLHMQCMCRHWMWRRNTCIACVKHTSVLHLYYMCKAYKCSTLVLHV